MTSTSSRFLIGTLLTFFIVLCILFAPFFSVFILTIVFGVLFDPINKRLRKNFGTNGAAFITILMVILVAAACLTFVVVQVLGEAGRLLAQLQSGALVPNTIIELAQTKVSAFVPGAHVDVLASFKGGLAWLVDQTGSIVQGIAAVFLNLFLSVIALYYWFKDSDKFRSAVLRVVPLSKEDTVGILDNLTSSVYSLIRGTMFVVLLQGISAGIGFTFFGVPNAILWASVTVVCALVPMLGTTIVFVPVVLYLALTGHTASAIGTALWGLIAVGTIDNIVGPRLMSRGSNMHPFFTLFAVIGGVKLFGAIGVFAGPLIVSLFFAICKTYTKHQEKSV